MRQRAWHYERLPCLGTTGGLTGPRFPRPFSPLDRRLPPEPEPPDCHVPFCGERGVFFGGEGEPAETSHGRAALVSSSSVESDSSSVESVRAADAAVGGRGRLQVNSGVRPTALLGVPGDRDRERERGPIGEGEEREEGEDGAVRSRRVTSSPAAVLRPALCISRSICSSFSEASAILGTPRRLMPATESS